MMNRLSWVGSVGGLATFLALSGAGCGSDVTTTGDGGNGGDSSSPSSTNTGGSTGDVISQGGSTATVTATCEDFANEPDPNVIEIRIANDTDHDLFLGKPENDCAYWVPYELYDPQSEPAAPLRDHLGFCDFTCKDLQEGGCDCPPGPCFSTNVIRIVPGGTYKAIWLGNVYVDVSMPVTCYSDATCGQADPTCPRAVTPPPKVVALAKAYDSVFCDPAACMLCKPDESGSCEMDPGPMVTGAVTDGQGAWETGDLAIDVKLSD